MSIDKDKIEALAPCIATCPQGNDIRAVLAIISRADKGGTSREEAFEEAWRILTRTNPLPAVCGRICPHPCESACNRCEKDCGVAVHEIERFLGDWAVSHNLQHRKEITLTQPERIAVIGSGPAGLACAYHLSRRGYKVTIFEALPETGGMLRYGIPAYRLPRHVIDDEVQKILDLGVELHTDTMVGRDIAYEDIEAEYDAVFIGTGAHQGVKLYCPGEDAADVISGVEFLRSVNRGETPGLDGDVVVVGGGDTAVDAARVARRLGSSVTILYHRTRREMPAIDEEIVDAEDEGVEIRFLTSPKEIVSENGRVRSIVCQRMKLGEPDESGRRRPIPIPDDEFTIQAGSVIVAVSQVPDWFGPEDMLNHHGWIKTNEWGSANRENTYAGGDVRGLGTVTDAIAHGTRAAEAIHARFREHELVAEDERPVVTTEEINLGNIARLSRHEGRKLSVRERQENLWAEIRATLPEKDVVAEASRCISCGSGFIKKKVTPLLFLRRFTQLGVGTILLNSYFAAISTRQIYDGPFRSVCVPGLSCHACPIATMGCPIGMMQHFAATHKFPFFLIGFLAIIGLVSGRFTCGWLCPFGLLQDTLHAFKKFTIRIPIPLNYFKYVVLIVVVIIIPYFTYSHWFSRLCPCGALIAAIPWAIWNPVDPVFDAQVIPADAIGTLYWVKIWILGLFLMLFLFIKRPFCRTVCPLGATYALFNRVSLVSLRVKSSCTDCGRCRELCPTDLDIKTEINSENCIKCMDCTQCEHVEFHWNLPWKLPEKLSQQFGEPAHDIGKAQVVLK